MNVHSVGVIRHVGSNTFGSGRTRMNCVLTVVWSIIGAWPIEHNLRRNMLIAMEILGEVVFSLFALGIVLVVYWAIGRILLWIAAKEE